MENPNYKGLEFIGGFSMLAGVLWVVGALAFGALVMVGQGRVDGPAPAASQTPAAEATATQ